MEDERIVPAGKRYLELKINFPDGQPIIFKTMSNESQAYEILKSMVEIHGKDNECAPE